MKRPGSAMYTFFKYFGWLVGLLAFVWLAMTSVTEFIVRSAVDAPYDEKLVDMARALWRPSPPDLR